MSRRNRVAQARLDARRQLAEREALLERAAVDVDAAFTLAENEAAYAAAERTLSNDLPPREEVQVLVERCGSVSAAARALGLPRATIQRALKFDRAGEHDRQVAS